MNKDINETQGAVSQEPLTAAVIESQMDYGDQAEEMRLTLPKDIISYFDAVAKREGVKSGELIANILINARLSEAMACARALRRAGRTA